MYFLEQLIRQYNICIFTYGVESGAGNPGQDSQDEKTNQPQTPEQVMMQDGQEGIDDIDEAQKYIEALKASEGIVGKHIKILGKFLEKVVNGEVPGLSKDDPEFVSMKMTFDAKILEYQSLTVEVGIVDDHMNRNAAPGTNTHLKDVSELGDLLEKNKQKVTLSSYLKEVSEKNGIPESALSDLLKQKFDYSDVADNDYEQQIAKEFLQNPDNFKKDVDALIIDWKKSEILTEGEESFSGENGRKILELLARNGSSDPVGGMMQSLGVAKEDIFGLNIDSRMSKVLKTIFSLFGIETTKDMLSSIGGSREAINGMLSQTGKMNELGSLSEFYESAGKGPDAINGDDKGKPSFGTYQLRADALDKFARENGIEGDHEKTFSSGEETDFSKNWKAKVTEIGKEKFQKLEHAFIKKTHFDILARNSGFDVSKSSIVVQNVIWSTAVQHGPGTNIIKEAVANIGDFKPGNKESEIALIKEIYSVRGAKFGEGQSRYQKEERMALMQLNILPGSLVNLPVGDIKSVQKEVVRNPDGSVKMTYCARTARINAQRLGVSVPQLSDARALENIYRDQGKLTDMPNGNVFQVFSGSKRFPKHGHVATGFVRGGQAFVLDPYLPATGSYSHSPIPLSTYKAYLEARRGGMRGIATIG